MHAILHNIRSVHNVGSIFRTADGLGVEKLYLTGYTPKPIDRFGRKRQKFSKVSLGAEDAVEWESKQDIIGLINILRDENFNVLACEPTDNAVSVRDMTTDSQHSCLVFGNEVDGLSQDIIEAADQTIKIPMQGKKSSFNVAVAFGMLMYQLIDK